METILTSTPSSVKSVLKKLHEIVSIYNVPSHGIFIENQSLASIFILELLLSQEPDSNGPRQASQGCSDGRGVKLPVGTMEKT